MFIYFKVTNQANELLNKIGVIPIPSWQSERWDSNPSILTPWSSVAKSKACGKAVSLVPCLLVSHLISVTTSFLHCDRLRTQAGGTPAWTSKVMRTLAHSCPLSTLWTEAHTQQGGVGPRPTGRGGVHRPWEARCFRPENCRLPGTLRTVWVEGGPGEGVLLTLQRAEAGRKGMGKCSSTF